MRHATTISANGSTAAWNLNNFRGVPNKSERTLIAQGTFGGGTLTFEASYDGGTTYIAIPDAAFTANNHIKTSIDTDVAVPTKVRGTLSGATGASLTVIMEDAI